MDSVLNLQNAVEYIENNISIQFCLDDLAKQCYLSPFYFHRLFSKTANMTITDYIKRRRLTIAARKIIEGGQIMEISREVGYVNYEQFSRNFKQKFSMSPRELQKNKTPIIFEPKLDFNLKKKIAGENEVAIFDQMSVTINVLRQDEIYMAGISKLCGIANGIDDPGMLWGIFHDNNIGKNIMNQPEPWTELGVGVTNYIENDVVHGFNYIAGRQVISYDNIHDSFVKYTIPAGLYAICRVEAENFDLLVNEVMYKAGGYMLNIWLPQNEKYRFSGDMTIEKYYPNEAGESVYFDYCFPVELIKGE